MCLHPGSTDVITEACLHVGQTKNMRQARYLVKRLKRFQRELPAAESRLTQLLSQQPAPTEGWSAYLAGAKAELQHMAQGMIMGSCCIQFLCRGLPGVLY